MVTQVQMQYILHNVLHKIVHNVFNIAKNIVQHWWLELSCFLRFCIYCITEGYYNFLADRQI